MQKMERNLFLFGKELPYRLNLFEFDFMYCLLSSYFDSFVRSAEDIKHSL